MTTQISNSGPQPVSSPRRASGCLARVASAIGALILFVAYLWGCGALWWSPLGPAWVRAIAVAMLLIAAVVVIWRLRGARRWLALVAVWLIPFAWFWFAPATNDANWQPASRIAPVITFDADRFTVQKVRNFYWRTNDDYDERWEERTYDLSKLRTMDLFMSYWGPTLICHTFVSFGFEDGRQLVISVEVRRKLGQHYGTLSSFFRDYELIYVFADELDVVYLRTNVVNEPVHLFRIEAPIAGIRGLLTEYIERANRMAAHPEWYNAITNSCGVNIIQNAWAEGSKRPVTWRLLFNGEWPRYAYDRGLLDPGTPFDQVFAQSIINARARQAGHSPEFSRAIRAGTLEVYKVPDAYEPTNIPTTPSDGKRP
ncbi:MAG: DUF4105 domain-containing protein [Tepidisphaeraceae bacterium]